MSKLQILIEGQAVSGTLATLISVIMLALTGNDDGGALFSFSFAAIFLSTVAFMYFCASRQPFFRFYSPDGESLKSESDGNVDFTVIIKNTWVFNLALFINYFVTLGVFPSIPSLAETTSDNKTWGKYFVPVGCFLIFNACDLIGRIVAGFIKWPRATKVGSVLMLLLAIFRLAFIPLFIFCHVSPKDRHFTEPYPPFESDAVYLLVNTLFGLTNGYLTNICMMCSPKMVEGGGNQSVAASFTVFTLVAGLLAGAGSSRLWVKLL